MPIGAKVPLAPVGVTEAVEKLFRYRTPFSIVALLPPENAEKPIGWSMSVNFTRVGPAGDRRAPSPPYRDIPGAAAAVPVTGDPRVGRGSPDRRCGSGPRTPPPAWRSASGRRGARRMDRVEVAVLQPVTHTKHAGDRQDRLHPRGSRLSDRAALLGLVAPEGRAPMNQVVQGHREEKRSLLIVVPDKQTILGTAMRPAVIPRWGVTTPGAGRRGANSL